MDGWSRRKEEDEVEIAYCGFLFAVICKSPIPDLEINLHKCMISSSLFSTEYMFKAHLLQWLGSLIGV
jgi:hypothetical protein